MTGGSDDGMMENGFRPFSGDRVNRDRDRSLSTCHSQWRIGGGGVQAVARGSVIPPPPPRRTQKFHSVRPIHYAA